ncbi:ATP-binding protein [Synechococcus sp. PCC 6312]|uniref:ATP-binding protein n=1 Tax=Synechococcus sp. (strain ATCC 27167 / PCC 6312) TaxID=195253 RepID=UPI00029EDFDA|nr:ATP-binding protein [Synechococcus sp. PCC 6312]AFY62631.1 histidine kinase with GAF domain [Synechococcus sp. PCC 6312]
MSPDTAIIFSQTLPAGKYGQFAAVLLAQTQELGERVVIQDTGDPLPEQNLMGLANEDSFGAEFPNLTNPGLGETENFTAIVAPDFTALLTAQATPLPGFLRLQLTFAPQLVREFLQSLPRQLQWPEYQSGASTPVLQVTQTILAELLNLCAADLSPQTSICQPQVNLAVQQRMQRERLIHQITTQIRQSLDLPATLNTAVSQIREFLQADRVLILQAMAENQGEVTYEAQRDEAWSSLLGVGDIPWGPDPVNWQQFRDGEILALPDITVNHQQNGVWVEFWQSYQVQSLLLVPIVVQGKVWGGLMAHACQQPRVWYPQEQEFLSHVCNHISIAIYQSQLYSQLQQQKISLEDRVAERTQALRQSLLAAEAAHRVKSDFLATISHELRSPLTCVIGMSATLLRWPLGPLTEKQRQYLETIHASGTHLLELINRILELSQVEVGQAALRIQSFSLGQLARQVRQRVRALAMAAQLNLKLELDIPAHLDTFTADPHRLQQVLIHLLTNAIKFTPAQGSVTLRVECDGQEARFAVSDTGIGIPSHLQPLLFQLFQQLDTPYRRRHEGMGLGLAFVQQIVDLHQGTITVQSREDHGSTFFVSIPLQAWESSLTALPIPASEGRIILIEEQEDTATLICELLTAAGYQVIWVTDPVIEQLSHFQPWLIIVSQRLDRFNLNRLVEHLQAAPSPQPTKVILLCPPGASLTLPETGSEPEPSYLRADACLHYPLDPEELLTQVTALIQPERKSLFTAASVP